MLATIHPFPPTLDPASSPSIKTQVRVSFLHHHHGFQENVHRRHSLFGIASPTDTNHTSPGRLPAALFSPEPPRPPLVDLQDPPPRQHEHQPLSPLLLVPLPLPLDRQDRTSNDDYIAHGEAPLATLLAQEPGLDRIPAAGPRGVSPEAVAQPQAHVRILLVRTTADR
jgi:hypothetical protein